MFSEKEGDGYNTVAEALTNGPEWNGLNGGADRQFCNHPD